MLHQAPASDEKQQRKFRTAARKIWKTYHKQFEEINKKSNKLIIAISGNSGSGKSSIAYYLCKLFIEENKKNAKHLWTDDFYLENYKMMDPTKRNKRRDTTNYQNIGAKEYNWKEIALILDAFRNGTKCRMPCVDLLNQQIDWLETDFKNINVLVIEGLFAIDLDKNILEVNYKFFIEGGTIVQLNNKEQRKHSLVQQKILEAEHKAISKIKEDGIANNDLIALAYNEQNESWQLRDFYQQP